jgi:hypothetical protein
MASSGRQAWLKYFQGRGNIESLMKKESLTYDMFEANKRVGNIAIGQKVIVLSSTEYDSKAAIQYKSGTKDITVRVPFNNIAKPNVRSSAAASLKPQAFGIEETKYGFDQYVNLVKESIEERTDLTAELRSYLSILFDYYSKAQTTKQNVTKVFNKVKTSIPINDVNKDFGEVLGPVAVLSENLLRPAKINLTKNICKIYVPKRPNEPLMDYGLYQNDKQVIISAKSGKTTNVVKPSDVITLLNKNDKTKRKWKDTKEYKILEILSNNSIINGPLLVIAYLYPTLMDKEVAATANRFSHDNTKFAPFINNNEYLKNKEDPTLNEIMYECEKMIQEETKTGSLYMNSIFADAIKEEVVYIKFELDPSGVGKWDVIVSKDIQNMDTFGRAYLRTKNGYTRASDRMGIQI